MQSTRMSNPRVVMNQELSKSFGQLVVPCANTLAVNYVSNPSSSRNIKDYSSFFMFLTSSTTALLSLLKLC